MASELWACPTVGDRIAQSVVARVLEVAAEPVFHPDSYGYRPGRSAIDAVAVCRRRCWKADWVIDLDIAAFFDTVRWNLVLKAVAAHTDQPWVVLYVQRWLSAPLLRPDGTLQTRDRGTPQGSSVSPILANLFLHYAFDAWMAREFPTTRFERYVDDVVVHCHGERETNRVLAAIRDRMSQVGLTLHPEKTRIVYCQDDGRREDHEHVEFTFLGYTFKERSTQAKNGTMFRSFLPAISKDALKRISAQVRSWRLHQRTHPSEADLARWINPIVRGWMNYYGAFYKSALYPLLERINAYLMRYIRKKHKRLRSRKKAQGAWNQAVKRRPRFFAHWAWTTYPPPVW
jgi:RNA-directed DNA polymerase